MEMAVWRWLCVAVVVATVCPAAAQETQPAKLPWEGYTFLNLSSEEHAALMQRVEDADLAWEDFRKRYPKDSATTKPASDDANQEAANVLAAYQTVLDRYPGSKMAAYAATRMAGFYNDLGQPDKSLEMLKDVAHMYQRTPDGQQTAITIGLHYAQHAKKPAEAIAWFKKVPMPDGLPITDPDDKRRDTGSEYFLAQQHIAKVTLLQLGKPDEAKIIFDDLGELYPIHKDDLERSWKFLTEEAESAAREAAKRKSATTQPAKRQ